VSNDNLRIFDNDKVLDNDKVFAGRKHLLNEFKKS